LLGLAHLRLCHWQLAHGVKALQRIVRLAHACAHGTRHTRCLRLLRTKALLRILPKALRILPKALRVLPKALRILPKALRVLPKALRVLLFFIRGLTGRGGLHAGVHARLTHGRLTHGRCAIGAHARLLLHTLLHTLRLCTGKNHVVLAGQTWLLHTRLLHARLTTRHGRTRRAVLRRLCTILRRLPHL